MGSVGSVGSGVVCKCRQAWLEIWLVLNRRRRGPLDLWEVPKPSVPPVAEAASASGSETVLVLVALITTKSAVNEQYVNVFLKTRHKSANKNFDFLVSN